jgi:hypothetical protein
MSDPHSEAPLTELEQILAVSRAAEAFKCAVRGYYENIKSDLVHVEGRAPRIKVRRLLTQILQAEPVLAVERVSLRAESGCSDFVGTVEVETASGTRLYDFAWDCRWRAEQEGWMDYFGLPDQIRAAAEFDWRCFRHWESVEERGAGHESRAPMSTSALPRADAMPSVQTTST